MALWVFQNVHGMSQSAWEPEASPGDSLPNLQRLSRVVATRAQDVGQFSLMLPAIVREPSVAQGTSDSSSEQPGQPIITQDKQSHCVGNVCMRREPTTPAPKASIHNQLKVSERTTVATPAPKMVLPTPAPKATMDESLATVTALSFVSSAIVTFAPMTSIFRVLNGEAKSEEVAGLAAPYFFLFAQGYFWALYGLVVGNADIAAINILGIVVAGFYLIALAGHEDPDEPQKTVDDENLLHRIGTVRNLLGMSTLACGVISACNLSVEDQSLRSELLAYTALCFNMGMVLAPLRQCADALKKKAMEGFPVALTIANFMSCGLWAQYSALTHNMAYLVPNMLGLLCNGIQMCVVAWVYIWHGKSEEDPLRERRSAADLLRAVAAYSAQSSETDPGTTPLSGSRFGFLESQSAVLGGTGGAQ